MSEAQHRKTPDRSTRPGTVAHYMRKLTAWTPSRPEWRMTRGRILHRRRNYSGRLGEAVCGARPKFGEWWRSAALPPCPECEARAVREGEP